MWRVQEEEETTFGLTFNSEAVGKCRLLELSASVLGSVVCGECLDSGCRAVKESRAFYSQYVTTLSVTENSAATISIEVLRKSLKIEFCLFRE